MHSPLALLELQSLLFSHTAIIPVAGGAFAGVPFALFRRPLAHFRPFGVRESESIMNFSSLGTLRCICGAEHMENALVDRRQFCRSCGCEVVATNPALLDKQLTKQEIVEMTRSLRHAAIRAAYMELPPSITTVEELHRYLDSSEPKSSRTPPTQSTPVEQPTVH